MRPTRRAAAVAAAAVARPMSPSPISSEGELDEMQSSELEELDNEQGLSEEDEIEEEEEEDDDQVQNNSMLDNNDDLESLSEQEELDEEDEDMDNEEEEDEEEEEEMPVRKVPAAARSVKRKKPVIENDSEEEIFSDDAEIVRNRPMTKRQRAKVYQEIPEEYLELPMDTGKKKLTLTVEEEQLKKSEVARRRKNQSIQRAEKDKADTINRLLKKQASKSKRIIDDTEDKETAHEKLMKSEDPNRLRYVNTAKGAQLCIPSVYSIHQIFGHIDTSSIDKSNANREKKCEVHGCSNHRKYTAKKSGKSVCSLEHYKIAEAN